MSKSLEEAQLEMQQKLGRCMIRLQQYERLLKAMVASNAIEGPPDQLEAVVTRQEAGASDKSLGILVGMFTDRHLISAASDDEVELCKPISGGQSSDAAWAGVRFGISMSPERLAQTKNGLKDLIAMRNDLVHHLIERFDISDESGCLAATAHLKTCYELIDDNCLRLKTWATGFGECRSLMTSLLESKAFEDAFLHGNDPDGSVCLLRSPIVEGLLEAETACEVGGWTSLAAAISFISKANGNLSPGKFGCRTWRQVLKKSGRFELKRGQHDEGGTTWYRSRLTDAANR